jgi:hypothetical protein
MLVKLRLVIRNSRFKSPVLFLPQWATCCQPRRDCDFPPARCPEMAGIQPERTESKQRSVSERVCTYRFIVKYLLLRIGTIELVYCVNYLVSRFLLVVLHRAVEHVLGVAEAVLLRLVLPAELGRVLKVLDAAVLVRVADGAGVRWVAIRRQHWAAGTALGQVGLGGAAGAHVRDNVAGDGRGREGGCRTGRRIILGHRVLHV